MLGLPTRKPRRFRVRGGGREGGRGCGDVWPLEEGEGGRAADAGAAAAGACTNASKFLSRIIRAREGR